MIKIKLFSTLRKQLGKDEIAVDVDETSVRGLIELVNPELIESVEKGQIRAAVNNEFADLNRIVKAGDEVALFPPVSGG